MESVIGSKPIRGSAESNLRFYKSMTTQRFEICRMTVLGLNTMKTTLMSVFFLGGLLLTHAATTNELSGTLQRGLFEEEANHNLDAAIEAYQSVVTQYDKDRKLAATAIFRLGECYRKQNKEGEARLQYERIVRDFSEQTILVEMSQKVLGDRVIETNASVSVAPSPATILLDNNAAIFTGQWQRVASGAGKYGPDFMFTMAGTTTVEFKGNVPSQITPERQTQAYAEVVQAVERTATYRPNIPAAGRYDVEIWFPNGKNRATNAPWLISYDGGQITVLVDQRAQGGKWITIATAKRFAAGTNGFVRLSNNVRSADSGTIVVADAVRFRAVNTTQTANAASSNDKQLTDLQAIRAQTQADWQENETILKELEKLPREKVRDVLPSLYPDKQLDELLDKLSQTKMDLAPVKGIAGNPFAKKGEAILAVLEQEIENRVEAITTALKVKTASMEAKLKDLDEQIQQASNGQNVRTAFSQRPAGVALKSTNEPMTDAEEQATRRIQSMVKDSPDLINAMNQTEAGTFLHQAAEDGRLNTAKFLLDSGADVDPRDKTGQTPLHLAARHGHKTVVELLLDHHANINAKTVDYNRTPLQFAAEKHYKTVVETLLSHGADVNLQNGLGETPLVLGAGSRAIVELLLAKNADVNLRTKQGYSPLHTAVREVGIVKMLLAHGADVHAAAQDGNTPLHAAVFAGNIPTAELFLNGRAEINATNNAGETPLYQATLRGDLEMVNYLLRRKADVSIRDRIGRTPLFTAAAKGFTEIAQTLLEHEADPNGAMSDKWTPLHVAASNGRKDIVEQLLKNRAAVNPLHRGGATPLDLVTAVIKGNANSDADHFSEWERFQKNPYPFHDIVVILKNNGGKTGQEVLRTNYIFCGRNGEMTTFFERGVSNYNQFTLLEFCGTVSWGQLPFPDLKQISIERIDPADGKDKILHIDLEAILSSGDCSRDQRLQWGDKINIPELDHPVNQIWQGLSSEQWKTIVNCTSRSVTVIVKNEHFKLHLIGSRDKSRRIVSAGGAIPNQRGEEIEIVVNDGKFYLSSVLAQSQLLRSSSDTTRVKVKRTDPGTKKSMELIVSPFQTKNDLWLRDGDLIEIPEKQ